MNGKEAGNMDKMMKSIQIEGKAVELQEEFPVRFACMEHFDQELDDYVNDYEAAPDTYAAQAIEDDTVDKRCRACGVPGQIALLREKGM
ncbi:CxxH/CxxC protein [Brevibacillus sp. NRS-1366]|uniref:CxxH/CxxC protein n=1 Tax=Brevibacillus sp. NRS-1366 TaxID=3233899 RepID=UPI003D21BC13